MINGNGSHGYEGVIQEILGRSTIGILPLEGLTRARVSVDATKADYAFWNRLLRGQERTYKLGGLFAKPAVHHVSSWVIGKGLVAQSESETTSEALRVFLREQMVTLINWYKTSLGLGDAFLVINPDGTLTEVPPDQVTIIYNELDYKDIVGYRIVSKLPKALITDEFRADMRTQCIKFSSPPSADEIPEGFTVRQAGRGLEYERVFPNLTGKIPVVHLPNERETNELFGHPMFEALLTVFAEYDDVLVNALEGVKTMSNPVPTISGVDNPQAEIDAISNTSATYDDIEGVTRSEKIVDLGDPASGEVIATSGKFSYEGPSPFTDDAWRMLKNLFYLTLQHTNIPEWVWGGHIESSNASVNAQLPAWTLFIDLMRLMLRGPLIEVFNCHLAVISLFTPGIVVDGQLDLVWAPVTDEDKELKLKAIDMAWRNGWITPETGLASADLVEDAEKEVQDAEADADEKRGNDAGERFDLAMVEALNAEED